MSTINIVVDTSDEDAWALGPRFVEVEDPNGNSITVPGVWADHPTKEGLSVLAINAALGCDVIIKRDDLDYLLNEADIGDYLQEDEDLPVLERLIAVLDGDET